VTRHWVSERVAQLNRRRDRADVAHRCTLQVASDHVDAADRTRATRRHEYHIGCIRGRCGDRILA
jgi:hypothetical protein